MLWLILLLCLGLVGMAGCFRGAIRAAFSFLGLVLGLLLAKPLAPLAGRLMPLLQFELPVWKLFMPGVIAFTFVLVVFKIVGNVVHERLETQYHVKDNELQFARWERLCQRVGLCVGLLNGVIYFFILMMPVYVAGYFTTEAAGADLPRSARLATSLRADLHEAKLDRVLAAYDPIPPAAYEAGDIIDLVLRNPSLVPRLAHYPPLVVLGETTEIKAIAVDVELQKLIQSQPKLNDLLAQPNIQILVTNAAFADQIRSLVGDDLPDLRTYLMTGKSPKYDSQTILGLWKIDIRTTLVEERQRNPNLTSRQFAATRVSLIPLLNGLSLASRLDNQIILKKQRPDTPEATAVAQGTWKSSGDSYEVSVPGNKPDTFNVAPRDGTLHFPRDGHVLVFNKET